MDNRIFPQKYAWNQKASGISTILVYLVEICFKDTVVNIHFYYIFWKFIGCYFHTYICEITVANNSRMGKNALILTKHFLNTKKFPQTAYVHPHLFSCLCDLVLLFRALHPTRGHQTPYITHTHTHTDKCKACIWVQCIWRNSDICDQYKVWVYFPI